MCMNTAVAIFNRQQSIHRRIHNNMTGILNHYHFSQTSPEPLVQQKLCSKQIIL